MTGDERDEPPKILTKKVSEMNAEEQKKYFEGCLDLWGTEFCTEFIRSCNHVVHKNGEEDGKD